jgi:alpha-glucosidase (family GH31 glycosyl hydrolase)
MRLCVVLALLAACGDDGLAPAPDQVSAGGVTIDTATLTLSVGSLTSDHFLAIGETVSIDESHYYDPRGDSEVELATVSHTRGVDGDDLVLEGGTRMRLSACAIADCAVLELDASVHAGATQLQIALPRDVGEPLYGTGDAPDTANVAGTLRELQLRVDTTSESSLNETHVPVPLVMWPRRNIGMFVADDRAGALDLGKTTADRVTATFTLPSRGTYKIFLFTAASPIDLVRSYVALTAKPAVPPRWAFAPQQWRNAWTSSAEVIGDADEMRTRKIPGSVMWIDNPWETAYNNHVIDQTRFANPAQLFADLTARGYKVIFWSTPYIGTDSANAADLAEGTANQFFVTDDSGLVIDYPWQNGPGAMVDFTRPGATEWWQQRLSRITSMGAAGFKLDFGEEVVTDIGGSILPMILAGGDNSVLHRRYAAGYHAAYLGALPPGDGFLITRAGTWGEQATNTTIWPGDLAADFTRHGEDNGSGKSNVGGLPSAISRGLSLSVSGYPFYGSDIGGFRGFPTTEALLRWAEYAAFGTIMQLGGGGQSHDPWDTTLFDPGADLVYKTYAELHMQLNPMLWTLALQAGTDGTPVTRPARFIYDCACDDAMFLLGDDILVAPVIEPGAATRVAVLPPGKWVDRATGLEVTGDGTTPITVPAALGTLPRWHRSGSLVPMFARAADTLLPATAAGVTSYLDPTLGRELRLVYTPGAAASTALHDGAKATANGPMIGVTGGTDYTVFTVDIDARGLAAPFAAPTAVSVDGTDLPSAADVTTCTSPGCFHFDAPSKHLEVRAFAAAGATRMIVIR